MLFTVVEMAAFSRDADKLLSEEEREELTLYVAAKPEAGDLIKSSGGARKLRWARKGGGKSGGYRVITYFYNAEMGRVFLFAIFSKSEKANLNAAEVNTLAKVIEYTVTEWKKGKKT